jgi:small subunit ribosomal protein S3e
MATKISKKRKFVADGVFYAELNELFAKELAKRDESAEEDAQYTGAGYSGVEVRNAPLKTEIIIRATKPQDVLGDKGRRIRELTRIVQKRFNFEDGAVDLFAERVTVKGLCATAQAESLRFKLLGGLAVRRACYGVMKFVMEAGAKGCEVIVTGKLRAQRAKAMKFQEGYMIKTGQAAIDYVDSATRHVLMRQGVLGVKVSIMLDHDPSGKTGPSMPLSDVVTIHEPKPDPEVTQPAPEQVQVPMAVAPAGFAAQPAPLE